MKIGILTFHGANNYGSVLQAYALATYLNRNGMDAETLDYYFEHDYRQYNLFRTYQYKGNPKAIVADCLSLLPHMKRKRNFEVFRTQYLKLSSKKMSSVEELRQIAPRYDAFICGSDQIWNLDCTDGVNDAYFLRFVPRGKRKIAYAPSMGSYSLKEKDRELLRESIADLDAISVREASMLDVISQTNPERGVETVLDPTMLLTADDYECMLKEKTSQERFVFVYILGGSKAYADILKCAQNMAQQKGCGIRYVIDNKNGGLRFNGKDDSGCSPGDFLTMIRDAEYVMTNSFHATVFSILFHKNFAAFNRGKSTSRITDLLKMLGLEACFWSTTRNFHYVDSYAEVDAILACEREKSKGFLKRALGIVED